MSNVVDTIVKFFNNEEDHLKSVLKWSDPILQNLLDLLKESQEPYVVRKELSTYIKTTLNKLYVVYFAAGGKYDIGYIKHDEEGIVFTSTKDSCYRLKPEDRIIAITGDWQSAQTIQKPTIEQRSVGLIFGQRNVGIVLTLGQHNTIIHFYGDLRTTDTIEQLKEMADSLTLIEMAVWSKTSAKSLRQLLQRGWKIESWTFDQGKPPYHVVHKPFSDTTFQVMLELQRRDEPKLSLHGQLKSRDTIEQLKQRSNHILDQIKLIDAISWNGQTATDVRSLVRSHWKIAAWHITELPKTIIRLQLQKHGGHVKLLHGTTNANLDLIKEPAELIEATTWTDATPEGIRLSLQQGWKIVYCGRGEQTRSFSVQLSATQPNGNTCYGCIVLPAESQEAADFGCEQLIDKCILVPTDPSISWDDPAKDQTNLKVIRANRFRVNAVLRLNIRGEEKSYQCNRLVDAPSQEQAEQQLQQDICEGKVHPSDEQFTWDCDPTFLQGWKYTSFEVVPQGSSYFRVNIEIQFRKTSAKAYYHGTVVQLAKSLDCARQQIQAEINAKTLTAKDSRIQWEPTFDLEVLEKNGYQEDTICLRS